MYHTDRGNALCSLERYTEAVDAYEQALRLAPSYAFAYKGKGDALIALSRYEEALAAYEQAIERDPKYAAAYNGEGDALTWLGRYEEAEISFAQGEEIAYKNAAIGGPRYVFKWQIYPLLCFVVIASMIFSLVVH